MGVTGTHEIVRPGANAGEVTGERLLERWRDGQIAHGFPRLHPAAPFVDEQPLGMEQHIPAPQTLRRRKRALMGLVPTTTTVLSQVFSIEERGRDLFDAAERLDLEGIVARRKADPYRPVTVWYKIKSRTYTQGEGRWELFQKRV